MGSYWVEFKDRGAGCVEADDEKSAMVAARIETRKNPAKATVLPYPADPRIVKRLHTSPSGKQYHIPSFCYRPNECKGKTCCTNPHGRSCVE